ncbi:D-xylose 1-dehydrogenase (NADP(+)) [Vanrija pseudolonga]|uniref:D-xylose 1-dehydrogenase (NADP(+), D-xylono-1,5-lactone-forming) n=1 Tax=Vanrija pseudolonga TaxID=143232 RepID=A0AAF0YCU1_9TREE|nr:D-xylose 1-dehydrogenase (NADP(+)) [Vanrija pseudolonga]
MAAPYTLRWGIISTGWISTEFTEDLLVDPATRNVNDVAHVVEAVGSRSLESAQKFIDKLKAAPEPYAWGVARGALDKTKARASYQEVYDDPDVDVVYIGTPVTHHHKDAKAALLAGKHVVCEKPFTFDLAELDELIAIAREKKLFLMEAVWTRFHPISYAVQDVLASGVLGRPRRYAADFSKDFKLETKPISHRLLAPELGGGGLLDMGPYPSVWAMLTLHQHPLNTKRTPPKVVNTYQTIYSRTGVDARSRWVLEFEELGAEGILMTDMLCQNFKEGAVVLQCEEGDLVIESPPQKPGVFHIVPHEEVDGVKERSTHDYTIPAAQGHGLAFEADAVARCIRDGQTECPRMPLDESRIVQSWFDAVRKNGRTVMRDMEGTAGK